MNGSSSSVTARSQAKSGAHAFWLVIGGAAGHAVLVGSGYVSLVLRELSQGTPPSYLIRFLVWSGFVLYALTIAANIAGIVLLRKGTAKAGAYLVMAGSAIYGVQWVWQLTQVQEPVNFPLLLLFLAPSVVAFVGAIKSLRGGASNQ